MAIPLPAWVPPDLRLRVRFEWLLLADRVRSLSPPTSRCSRHLPRRALRCACGPCPWRRNGQQPWQSINSDASSIETVQTSRAAGRHEPVLDTSGRVHPTHNVASPFSPMAGLGRPVSPAAPTASAPTLARICITARHYCTSSVLAFDMKTFLRLCPPLVAVHRNRARPARRRK